MKHNIAAPNLVGDVSKFFVLSQAELMVMPGIQPPTKTLELCYKLIDEEVNKELLPRLQKIMAGGYSLENMAALLDAYVDTVYVAIWGCVVLNLPFNPAWHEVQKANMAKFNPHDLCRGQGCDYVGRGVTEVEGNVVEFIEKCIGGFIVKRNMKTDKVLKPEGWVAPDIWDILYRIWTMHKLANDPGIIREKNIQTLDT